MNQGGANRELVVVGTFGLQNSSVSVHNVDFMVCTRLSFRDAILARLCSWYVLPTPPWALPRTGLKIP